MAVDPNEGASKQRAEELKQANIEGAKFKATMEGLTSVFKDFKKTSSDALKQDADLLGQLSSLSKGFGKAVSLSDKIKGFTVSDLKNAKQRNAFQSALTSAQGDQARVAADIAMLEETISAKVIQSNDALDSSKILREQLGALAAKMNDRDDYQISQQEKIESIKKKINSLDFEKNGLVGKAAEAKEKEIDALVEEEIRLEKILESSNKIFEKQKAKSNQLESDAQNLETLSSNYKDQSDFSTEILNTAKEYKKEIEGTVDAAGELNKKVEAVNKAGTSTLKAFAELGQKISATLPILGGLFDSVFGQLGQAQGMFEDAVAQGTSKMGARYKALTGSIQALTVTAALSFAKLAFEGAKTASAAFKEVKKGLGGGLIDASIAMRSASSAAGEMGIPLQEAAGYIGQMNSALGTSLGFSGKQVATFGKLTRNMGVSGEAAAKLFKFAVKTGTSYEDMAANVAGTTEKLNAMNGTAVAPKAVFEEMGNASQTILRNMKNNPDALIKAAAGARAMGMEMNKIADAAESTLDFESSMAKEMEAELMLGKDLNLDKLRAAAATGDQVTMQEEMKRLVMENKDALEGNVLAQNMMADTLGISKEEMNKMLNTTEDQAKMAEQDAARKKANAENEKKTAKELGQQQLKTFSRINDLADRINKFQESLSLGAYKFFNLIRDAFDPKDIMGSLGRIKDLVIKTFKDAFTGGDSVFKNILGKGSMLGMLLGAATMTGGALTIGFKGLGAIGSVFKKMRGTPMMPMFVKNIGDKTAGMFGKLTSIFKKKPAGAAAAAAATTGGKTKGILGKLTSVTKKKSSGNLVKSASSPSGFRDKMGRFAKAPGKSKAMAGASGGGGGGGIGKTIGGIGKGIGDFAKGIGKGFEGLMKGLAGGIKAFGNPVILKGAAILAATIGIIGAGIAAASWLMGKALPTLAEGMESIAELDGSALLKAGAGMAAVGIGLTAMAAGTAAQAVGGLMGAIGSFFGGDGIDEMLKKVEKFGNNYNFDAGKIENNARGVVAYALAMGALAVGAGAGAVAGLANLGSSLVDGLTASLGGSLPMDKVQAFGKWNLDADKIQNNARAVAGYALGMSALAGGAAASGIAAVGNLGSELVDGLTSVLGGDLPLDKVANFQKYNFDPEKVGNNAKAIASYALGMAALAGGASAGSLASLGGVAGSLVDGITGLLGGPLPLDKVANFQKYNFDPKKVKNNAEAIASYALGMAALAGGSAAGSLSSLGSIASSVVDGITGLLGGSTPLDKVENFQKYNFDPVKVKNNADAVSAYAIAMAKLGASSAGSLLGSLGSIGSQLVDGLAGFFGASTGIPYAKINELADAGLDAEKVASNAGALAAYAKAMSALNDVPSGFFKSMGKAGAALVEGIAGMFGGTVGIPYDKINEFANANLETEKIIKNAEALQAFGKAMSSLEDFDDHTDDFDDGVSDLNSGIKKFNKLKDVDTNKIDSLRTSMLAIKDATSIDLSNAGTVLQNLEKFASTVGKGVIKVDIAAKTIFSEELEGLTTSINESSNRELAELKKMSKEQSAEHRKELKAAQYQIQLLIKLAGSSMKEIKMDSYTVAKALNSNY
jgi:hypothetical protein